jgi:hypothetical protein
MVGPTVIAKVIKALLQVTSVGRGILSALP